MNALAERVWYGRGPTARVLRALLVPISWLYALVMRLRALAYRNGWRRAWRAGVPVVSVGNLSVGGTGKTPFVIWLVESLRSRGLQPVVVSRGYGVTAARPVAIAPAGRWSSVRTCETAPAHLRVGLDDDGLVAPVTGSVGATSTGAVAADEASLAVARTGCPAVTDPDRAAACAVAEALFAPDVIVLDDGFQHLGLARDLDVVLLGADDRGARVLPAGPLREPLHALRRADVLIARDGHAGALRATTVAVGLVRRVGERRVADTAGLRGKPIVAVCGIARPASFVEMLEATGARIVATLRFPDHHRYVGADWKRILGAAARGAELVVTTEKDLIKLAPLAAGDRRLLALRVDLELERDGELVERVARLDARGRGDNHRGRQPGTR